MDSCIIDIGDDFIVKKKSYLKMITNQSFIIILLGFIIIAQAGIFSITTKRNLELENNKKEARMLMNKIRNLSNKIVEEEETRLEQSNITTHEVKAWQAMYTGLSKGYGILEKIMKKDAAPSNSIAGNNTNNLNNTNGTNNGIINYGIIINCNHTNQ
ncbi:uncharacterized protein LOC132917940 [Rhopalosiphum padi]|uniref:uncharacterized protein LOC132917940 n=1 Tax=Rhopalosiphum padi TaxID=40932 RepID=UPI00298D8B80|nr:uncharacterized protein LOC132917940 [Rhopalosiphum padi]